jgi:hypothetical protein
MRTTTVEKENETREFAERAARLFKARPEMATYTDDGSLTPGALCAFRWGMGGDCVAVARLDEDFVPVNFAQLAKVVAK